MSRYEAIQGLTKVQKPAIVIRNSTEIFRNSEKDPDVMSVPQNRALSVISAVGVGEQLGECSEKK